MTPEQIQRAGNDPTSPLYHSQVAGYTDMGGTPKPTGIQYNTYNQPINSGTAVITPAKAVADVNSIKAQADQMQAGIAQQAQNKAVTQASPVVPPQTSTMSFSDKASKAQQYGMQNYTGTRDQDLVLLTKMAEEKATLEAQQKNGSAYLSEGQGTATPAVKTEGDIARDNLVKSQNDLINKLDAQYKSVQDTLAQYQNGTIPLTPDQQLQVDAMKQKAESLRQSQITANKQYEGAVTMAGIRSGRNMYAPGMEAGNISAAVSSGLSKLQDLDTQATSAIAQLQQSFKDSNYKMVKESWDTMNNIAKEKTAAIKSIYDTIATAEKDQRDFAYKQAQDQIQNIMKSDEFTYKQKQDAIDNALKSAQFDEDKRKNLVAEAQKAQELDVARKANDIAAGANSNPVVAGPQGTIDPVSQEKYLAQFPPDIQSQIKGIADYSVNLNTFATTLRKGVPGLNRGQMVALVKGYDPTFDEKEYAARQKFLSNWKAGGQNSVIVGANTAIQHLAELKTQADQLHNIGAGTMGPLSTNFNSLKAYLSDKSGGPQVTKFKQTATALAGELAKIYKNGLNSSAAPTDDEIKQQLDIMSTGMTPEQYDAIIENGITLMKDRLLSSTENYQIQMGKPPESILTPTAKKRIEELKKEGINVDLSGLEYNPYSNVSSNDLLNIPVGGSTSPANNSDFFGQFTGIQ